MPSGSPPSSNLENVLEAAGDRPPDVHSKAVLASVRESLFGATKQSVRIGRYVVIDCLGVGGMGVVYTAYDPELDRRIALKLIRPHRNASADTQQFKARLLREAQAMASLSHPNVIAVYDVGSHEGDVFIAMELVEGTNLTKWLSAEPRRQAQILEVFVAAGRGLAAAHRGGLVHRDFKPDNLVIDAEHRVRVVDFGLARRAGPTRDVVPAAPTSSDEVELTQAGEVVGTPAYMAPEQHRGDEVTARGDQYAFCVALWEALCGERPFAGNSIAAVAQAKVRAPPPDPRLPRWLARVLRRGLSPDPEDRFPDMEALLAALARDPARRRKWGLAAVAGSLGLAAGLALYADAQDRRERQCVFSVDALAGAWDAERRAAAKQAFSAAGVPFAADTWSRVEDRLDEFASAWTEMRVEACESAKIRGTESEAVHALRLACLEERKRELVALTDLLMNADAPVVERATQAVYGMTAISSCEDVERLLTAPPTPPASPANERGRARLAEVRALSDAGKYADALARAQAFVDEGPETDDPVLDVELAYEIAELQAKNGQVAKAEERLYEVVAAAKRVGHPEMEAQAWSRLVAVVGFQEVRHDEGERLAEVAAAAVDALGEHSRLRADLQLRRGNIAFLKGEFADALAYYEAGLSTAEAALGPDHLYLAPMFNNIGAAHQRLSQYEDAIEDHLKALEIRRAALGPDHPEIGASLNNLCSTYFQIDRIGEAKEACDRALVVFERAYGAESWESARPLNNLGAIAHGNEDYAAALGYHERALSIQRARLGDDHPDVALSFNNMGSTLSRLGRHAEAEAAHRRALSIYAASLGEDHPSVAGAWSGLGHALYGEGELAEARAAFERALAIAATREVEPGARAEMRFGLARTLWDLGGDRSVALELARQALADHASLSDVITPERREAQEWLDARGEGD